MKLLMKMTYSGQTLGNNTYIILGYNYIYELFIRSKDEHNNKVKHRLADEIFCAKENVYSTLLIDSMLCANMCC